VNEQRRTGSPRVLHVVTSALSIHLMRGQLRYLKEAGFDVIVISSPGDQLERVAKEEGVKVFGIEMKRGASPLRDLLSLWRLWRLIRQLRPDLTNVSTPKAGLLGGVAAWLNRVQCRFYTLRGLRWETTRGFQRCLLMFLEALACRCANSVLCVSESVQKGVVNSGTVSLDKTLVLGAGSSNGVDAPRFAASEGQLRLAQEIRQSLSIASNSPVVGFIGRLTRDKGVPELVEAHRQLRGRFPTLRLLLVGSHDEKGDALPREIKRALKTDPSIVFISLVDNCAAFYHALDILALPTYREGFPNVILEAHAAGKPVVTFRATGAVDAVVDGVDGIVVPVGDIKALVEALAVLLHNPCLAETMGRNGYDRVVREFQPVRIWSALAHTYVRSLEEKGVSCAAIRLNTPPPSFVENLQEASK
jgi:glycosyltransferase involved in cell wall biosynthesis